MSPPMCYIRNFSDLNRFQRKVMTEVLTKHTKLSENIIREIIRNVDGFYEDEFRGITIMYPRVNLLVTYGCISIDLDNNEESEIFWQKVKSVYKIREFQRNYHNTEQSLYGYPGTRYSWGNNEMEAIDWGGPIEHSAKFLEKVTNQKKLIKY